MIKPTSQRLYSIALNGLNTILLLLSVTVFAIGFFPYKPFIPGTNEFSTSAKASLALNPPFNKIILMVVDALRSDFVYSDKSNFAFVQSLIRKGHAIPFTAHASSPTITMPKIKAITTGSVPSFLDVILNFAESETTSSLLNTDTWLKQLRRLPHGNLIMHGDDTWLKLFPNFFKRADGTSSFFVSDFIEVDNNVTRHVRSELENEDWNGWFMHYLGLDHIGHKSGPDSPNMLPKQREMDSVVKELYQGIITKKHLASTLIVLCGDHGMNDAGNHGGSGPGETSPALVFISPKLEPISSNRIAPVRPISDYEFYTAVEQVDIAATVSALLGLPPPMNNIGIVIPVFLGLWNNLADRMHLLEQNVLQIHHIIARSTNDHIFSKETLAGLNCATTSSDIEDMQCGLLALNKTFGTSEQRQVSLYKYLKAAQRLLSTAASNYDVSKLGLGIIIAAIPLVSHIGILRHLSKEISSQCGSGLIITIVLLYSILLFASSYVEEEHQFWYWLSNALGVYAFLFRPSKFRVSRQSLVACLSVMSLLRITRRWNQTGQKFVGAADIGRSFMQAHNYTLWMCVLATHIYYGFRLRSLKRPGTAPHFTTFLEIWLNLATIIFRLCYTSAEAPELIGSLTIYARSYATPAWLVIQARIVYVLVFFLLGLSLFGDRAEDQHPRNRNTPDQNFGLLPLEKMQRARYVLTFFLVLESRVNNIPIFLLMDLIATILEAAMTQCSSWSAHELGVTAIILQHTFFFSFGGSNAISSIDLSNAYNGVSGFSVVAVALLTFVSNWAGSIWWALTCSNLLQLCRENGEVFIRYSHVTGAFACGAAFATMLACTALRTHLFIWTVFSPKYLYTIAWTTAQHVFINNLLVWAFHKI